MHTKLEEAAKAYADNEWENEDNQDICIDGFKAGYEWACSRHKMYEDYQTEVDRLKAALEKIAGFDCNTLCGANEVAQEVLK